MESRCITELRPCTVESWKHMIVLAFYFVQGTDIMLYYTPYFLDLSNTSMFILHYP